MNAECWNKLRRARAIADCQTILSLDANDVRAGRIWVLLRCEPTQKPAPYAEEAFVFSFTVN